MNKYNKPCVFGCNTTGKVVHRFPDFKKYPEQFNAWVYLAGKRVANLSHEYICRNKRVCEIHFKLEHRNRNSRLSALAVPSLHLPNCISDEVRVIETPSSTIVSPNDSNISEFENVYNTNELAVAESVTKCRFCMMEIIEAKNIFEDNIDHVPIHLAVKVCLYPIEVSITEHLSTYVCVQCLNTVSSFLKFRAMVFRNDKILRKHLDESILSVSKGTPDQKQNIDNENEPHLMKKIKIDRVPEYNLTNQGEEKRNNSMENIGHSQQVAKCTIPLLTLISNSTGFVKASLQKTNNQKQGGRDLAKTIMKEDIVKQSESDVIPGQHVEKSEIEHNINESSSATPISIIGTYGVSKRPRLANQVDEKQNNSNDKFRPDQQVGKFVVEQDISESSEIPISQSAAFVEALLPKTYNNEQKEETIPMILEDNIKQSDSDFSPGLLVVQPEIEIDNNKLFSAVPSVIRTYSARKRPKLPNQDEEKQNHSKENLSPDQLVEKSKVQLDVNQSPSATPISRSIAFVEALLQKTNNEEQERGTMPRTLILEEVDVSDDSQTNYDNVAFCLADGYLMEHKILKGNLRYLKCALAKCPAVGTQKVLIPGLFENSVSITKHHNHKKPTEMDIKKQKFISVIRKRLQIAKGLSIKSIYDEVCKVDPDLAQLVPMKDLKKAICNL